MFFMRLVVDRIHRLSYDEYINTHNEVSVEED